MILSLGILLMNYRHDNRPEDIRCAAIYYNDGKEYPHQPRNIDSGYVLCGLRHHNCFVMRNDINDGKSRNNRRGNIQGFLTSKDRFVTRKEAAQIAFNVGQIAEPVDVLFSEDLY